MDKQINITDWRYRMLVKELKRLLSKQNDNNEVIFYNLENHNLEQYNLESIVDADGRCEITTTKEEIDV